MTFPFDQEILLENERALLRPLQMADVENLLQVTAGDEKLIQYSPSQIHSKELLHQYIELAIQERARASRYPFVIYDKKQNAYAGSSSFLHIANADSRLEIGATWIGKRFQQTGLNRHCKFLLLDFAFVQLGAERVEFRTDERNAASRTAIEKIGGRFEGTLRSHTLMRDQFRRNTVVYSILRNEWKGLALR
jgi:RimJ/RimL family protein N-acetyltransferase